MDYYDHHIEFPFTVEDQIVLNAMLDADDMLADLEANEQSFEWLFKR